MSGQTSGSLIILIILGLVSWYYYNKFQESEQNYRKLYYQFEKVHIKNKNMQIRIHDLESYRNDISKTFNVLDKELVAINSHLQRRNNNDVNLNKTASANVSILTPELLNSLLSESEVNIKGEINSVSNDNKDEVDTIIDDNKVEQDINSEVGDNVINEIELGLQENYGNLEKEGFHSDIELEHLNFKLGDNYNKFLIN